MSGKAMATASRWLRWGQPKCTCGDRECEQLDYEVLGVPAWILALLLVVVGTLAVVAYTVAQRV
ncbi:hypothetical protein HHL19_36480 [Streptomyces sp. R302]|uniref:hypothetical protein n=1 Tax=unclassified Streptomyces TaxID=2593676 RepID=UPI00145CB125|nr:MULTISPECIES: hypothetical protein [unclassified Streptomyces]NML55649.1 hypothetical protein [Streptomyces sp. R301]NML84009.1 hypothetical protein [Streptomyces sp. R302]